MAAVARTSMNGGGGKTMIRGPAMPFGSWEAPYRTQ